MAASAVAPKTLLSGTVLDMVASSASSLTHRRALACSASRLVPRPPDLARWVRTEGGFVHPKLRIADSSYGLGVVSADDIPPGSDLIVLPTHLPLQFHRPPDPRRDGAHSLLAHLASKVPVYPCSFAACWALPCGEHVAEELWAMRLGLRLLQERATVGSLWWPYISNLPEAFTVPIFFPGGDVKSLQYAPLLHQVNKRCRFLLEFEKEVKNILDDVASKDHPFGGQDVNAASLGWAMSAVSSRAFRLHGEILSDGKHSEVVAETHINGDTPVTLNYGCLSNDLFLLDYGFVIPSNPYDQVELKYDETLLDAASTAAGVSSPSFQSPAKWQQEILSQLNLQGDGALLKVTLGGPELVDGRLLAALRALLTTESEKVKILDLSTLKSLGGEAPLGSSVEAAALRTIIALCVIALEHFPTKIMEDESVLKAGASYSTELAVQFRMQKKLMIIDVMRKLTQRVKMLSKEKSAA
ncbi:hypothetical protein ACMD2_00017 [Ananas comosus]|uniref:Rubisco LSMT substrate-binding domain-containing protein n=1 Tax=Ananas comosus TaxID=4615 RepID=A0A199VQT7_ANACO|nr:hypothetical protein ACMD2_00017 [Ananas comosus]